MFIPVKINNHRGNEKKRERDVVTLMFQAEVQRKCPAVEESSLIATTSSEE